MFRIVQTIWIDQLRARDTRREEDEDEGMHVGTDEPGRRAEARLALQEVRIGARELPPEQRVALLLVTVDGLSYKEAAEVAEVPVGTIMSRLARARVALQAKLDAGGGLRRSTQDVKADDDRLIAYLDGELEESERAEIARSAGARRRAARARGAVERERGGAARGLRRGAARAAARAADRRGARRAGPSSSSFRRRGRRVGGGCSATTAGGSAPRRRHRSPPSSSA